jgi:hydroxymethylpyrimidine pyrophosphatase-like HAD family hydrolase
MMQYKLIAVDMDGTLLNRERIAEKYSNYTE